MEQRLQIPGQEPQIRVHWVEVAQELQTALEETADSPVLQNELLLSAMEVFDYATEIFGGHKIYLHSRQAFIVNPRATGPHSLNVEEATIGEAWLAANFNGIVHFEEYLHQSLNSLCLDLTEVKVINDISSTAEREQIMGTVIVPVNQIETVMAA